jgi:Na+/proline symporter
MPEMARRLAPHPLIAGLLLASPYAAVMSAVAAFLLMISSSLVRDIYQRTIDPAVSDKVVKRLSYTMTALVGVGVMIAAMRPPDFLQYLIVFAGSGQSSSFLFPMLLSLYWKQATKQGVLSGMLGGACTIMALYLAGWMFNDKTIYKAIEPYYLFGFDPLVWGFSVSAITSIGISLLTRPDPRLVEKYFPQRTIDS